MTKSRPNVTTKPTYKAPRKALATRAVDKPASPKPSSPKLSGPKAGNTHYPYATPKMVEERIRKFAPPSDEEMFDTAVEYCEYRLLKFRKQFYQASCHFIEDEDDWRTAIRYHNKFTWAFENFFEHVRIKYGFEGKDTGFRPSKIEKATFRKSLSGSKVVHQWTEEAVQLVRPNIKALESFKH
jgi:hypothetical protein